MDGRRSVSEIRDVLTGRYVRVTIEGVAEYLDFVARARVVTGLVSRGSHLRCLRFAARVAPTTAQDSRPTGDHRLPGGPFTSGSTSKGF